MTHDATWTLRLLVYSTFVLCVWIVVSLIREYMNANHPVQAWVLDLRRLTFAERVYVGIVLWNVCAKTWPTPVPQAFPPDSEDYGNRVRN